MSDGKENGRARGIDRVVAVLEFLRHSREPIGIGELARRIDAPRSSLYEIIDRLTAAGILEFIDDRGRVFFGRAVYFYADAYLASQPLVRRGRDEVIRLSQITGETAQLCMLVGNKYSVVHMHPGANLFRISSETGVLVPIPWTASGRLLLGHMSDKEIRALIPSEDFRLPDGRTISFEEFCRDVRQAGKQDFAVTSALADQFTTCLAAPIRDDGGRSMATICFVIPVHTSSDRQAQLLKLLRESGHRLSAEFQGASQPA